jgi:hypothetical protein
LSHWFSSASVQRPSIIRGLISVTTARGDYLRILTVARCVELPDDVSAAD